jgi:hypothetical protein
MRAAQTCGYVLGFLLLVSAIGAQLLAAGPAPVPAPEIDGNSIGVGLGLLAAGVLTVRAFKRSR